MDILVFKTNIRFKKQIMAVGRYMDQLQGVVRWNVDLDDCDKILRIEARNVSPRIVSDTLIKAGYYCEELPD